MLYTLDFETYYDNDYSLSKMSTSEYVRHENFKIHLVGVKEGDKKTKILTPSAFSSWIETVDWSDAELLCHHTAFDGFILSQRFGKIPSAYRCSLSTARASLPGLPKYDLGMVAASLGIKGKVEGVLVKTKGVRDLTPEQSKDFARYCARDVDITYEVYQKLLPHMPERELRLIDLTLRMFCDPVLKIDIPRVQEELGKEVGGKVAALLKSGVGADEIVSNQKFAALLERNGVSVPKKLSPSTGLVVPALSKNDPGFKALLHHPDEIIRKFVEARLKLRSSIGETRARRFLEEGKDGHALPVYLHYYGAHTGRWSGGNRINLQNLPRGGELRKAIVAPEGYVICVVDSSQIEARITAWYAEEKDLLDGFVKMGSEGSSDIYTSFATQIYGRNISRQDKIERFVGKTCILGLGFGMGPERLRNTLLAAQTPVDIPYDVCRRIVQIYRRKYSNIVYLWHRMDRVIEDMYVGLPGEYKCISWGKNRILKPSELFLFYKNLQPTADLSGWEYEPGRNMKVKVYGGILTENIVQGTARDVVAEQMLSISTRYRVVMMTHDEIAYLAPSTEAQEALDWGLGIMSTAPSWAPGLPLAAEGGYDGCYSK